MNDIYKKRNQRRVVTALLGGVTKIDGEYIIETKPKARDYFAKGHLAPDANFVYEVLQDATYYFINVAPQVRPFWISFKSPYLSVSIIQRRKLESPRIGCEKSCLKVNYIFAWRTAIDLSLSRLKRDLQVTTGTFGILEYPDAHQQSTSIFLSSPYLPAPKLFWKVVLDPATGQSAAFMGLNDPHATVAPKTICKNRFAEYSSS